MIWQFPHLHRVTRGAPLAYEFFSRMAAQTSLKHKSVNRMLKNFEDLALGTQLAIGVRMQPPQTIPRPTIFEFRNYRLYLKDLVAHRRSIGKYSERKFCAGVGFKSFSFMRMIISGKRSPSRSNLERIAFGLELNRIERHFLALLWALDRAETASERRDLMREIFEMRSTKQIRSGPKSPGTFRVKISMEKLNELAEWIRRNSQLNAKESFTLEISHPSIPKDFLQRMEDISHVDSVEKG